MGRIKLHTSESKAFSAAIKGLRKDLGMTQQEFADDFSSKTDNTENATFDTIKNWEQRYNLPTVHTLVVLAKTYNRSLDYLLGLSKYRNVTEQEICSMTGLSPKDVNILIRAKNGERFPIHPVLEFKIGNGDPIDFDS